MADPERVGDGVEDDHEVEEEEETTGMEGLALDVLSNPEILAALQSHRNAQYLLTLPPAVKRRIKALKKLQLEMMNIEAKFYEEIHLLEYKYQGLYLPLYSKRGFIVSGLHDPQGAECEWGSDDDEELSAAVKNKIQIEEVEKEEEIKEDPTGIPEFWLKIFKNVSMLSEMVQEHDEPILKHLIDVKTIILKENPMGFVLEFHFEQNKFFSNSVLHKEYEMKCAPDESDPFSFEGPEIYKCKGCIIDWHKGMNVTVKTIKKKQKHKSRGSVRTVTKTVQNDSFFNFFTPPCMPDDPEADLDDDTQALITTDFEIGHYIRERIIPRAVLYFTGEALEDEEDYEEEEEEGEEGEEEDEEEEFDEYAGGNNKKVPVAKNVNPGDCKQQ